MYPQSLAHQTFSAIASHGAAHLLAGCHADAQHAQCIAARHEHEQLVPPRMALVPESLEIGPCAEALRALAKSLP